MSTRKKVSHKLEDVVWRELGEKLDKDQQQAAWHKEITPEMRDYAARDTEILLPVLGGLEARLQNAGLRKTTEIEHRVLPAMAWMKNAGVPFDVEGWRRRLAEVEEKKERLKEKLVELAPAHPEGKPWNWNSPKQIKEAFGLFSVDLADTKEETLSRCSQPLAETLLRYKKASKLVGTYGEKLLEQVEDGRIYGSWWQIGAGTGRMASSSPNLQNLPPEVRRYVKAPGGRRLVIADYSQIELRIGAKIAQEERMLAAFADSKDIHEITARSLTGREEVSKAERKLAKAVNFGLLYGMGPNGLRGYARASYGVEMTSGQAERYWSGFFRTYPGLKAWHDREYQKLNKYGNTETRTLAGRRRTGVGKLTERLNSPVQGTGADGIKLALALLYERRSECPGAVPILAVHDEIVVECSEGEAEKVTVWLKKAMVDGMDQVLNRSGVGGPSVSVEVELEKAKSWGGEPLSDF